MHIHPLFFMIGCLLAMTLWGFRVARQTQAQLTRNVDLGDAAGYIMYRVSWNPKYIYGDIDPSDVDMVLSMRKKIDAGVVDIMFATFIVTSIVV